MPADTPLTPEARAQADAKAECEKQHARADAAESALTEARQEIADAMAVLQPNMPESGLVDACKQVKQVAISEADNSNVLESRLAALTAAVQQIQTTFQRDEDQGYRSKDRQFAIAILSQALAVEVAQPTLGDA